MLALLKRRLTCLLNGVEDSWSVSCVPLSQLFETACLYDTRAPLSQSGRSLVRAPEHHLGQTGRAVLYYFTSIVGIVLICETTALTCPVLSDELCTA